MSSRHVWRCGGVGTLVLVLVLLLAGCTDTTILPASTTTAGFSSAPAPSDSPALVTASPDTATATKVDDVYLQLFAIYQTAGPDAARQFARLQGLLTPDDEIRVTLVLDTSDPAIVQGTALAVGRSGGRVTATYDNQIELVVPIQTLAAYGKQSGSSGMDNFFGALADFRHVRDVHRTAMAQTSAIVAPVSVSTGIAAALVTSGRSEGVDTTDAAQWQAAGITGKGVKVGVIDVGFTNYAAVLGTGHVTTRSFREDSKLDAPPGPTTMHGTACAEIVREMAPDADLFLAAAGDTPGGFITALRWLTRTMGVSVISTSLGFYGDYPTDGTSDLARAVDEAKAAGVVFVKSAGNQALQNYRSTFTDTDTNGENDFPGAAQPNALRVMTTGSTLQVWLNWDDWTRPHVTYDLSIYDAAGNEVARSTEDQRRTGKRPVQEIVAAVPPGTYFVRIDKVYPDDPSLPFTLITNPGTAMELTVPDDSITVPGDARGAVAVGAVNWQSGQVERFSSRGPTPDGRTKPDLSAPDGVTSIAFGLVGTSVFSGTSAAAPHVAGAVALYRSVYPNATPDEVLAYLAMNAVTPPEAMRGDNAVGAGRLSLGNAPMPGMPIPTVAATRTGAAINATRTLATSSDAFADDFTSPASGLPPMGYTSGTYHLAPAAGSLTEELYPVNVTAPSTTFTVQARRTGGANDAPMGLIARAVDRDNYLLFVVTNDGAFNVYAQLNGSLRALLDTWKTSAAIARDGPNTLKVEATGTHFVFSANGQPLSVVEITDVWTTGAFGFAAGGGKDADGDLTFNAFRVNVGK